MDKCKFEEPDDYFNKLKTFNSNKNCLLPKNAFSAKKWVIKDFQDNKNDLNKVKGKLNEFDLDCWSKHTRNTDPSSFIISKLRGNFNIELLTQAWCKFYECLCKFSLVPILAREAKVLNSVHICEAPGAFVCALNHYLELNHPQVQWKWLANTLNPNYEGNSLSKMVDDDRLIQSTTKNWHFGADFSGDIMIYYNHESIIKEAEDMGPILLVTADGSINCMKDPGEQEVIVEHLHYCEMMTALKILSPGGNFVLKIFTMFEESTICHLYLLNAVFKQVNCFKPATSKSGNSEIYLVCLNYHKKAELMEIWDQLILPYKNNGTENSMYAKSEINMGFMHEIMEFSKFFMKRQISTIERNIFTFINKLKSDDSRRLKQLKYKVADLFFKTYTIYNISDSKRIVPDYNITSFWPKRKISTELHISGNCEWIDCNDLLDQKYENFIDVKTGKEIVKINSSKFCSLENLDQLQRYLYEKEYVVELAELGFRKNSYIIYKINFDFTKNFNSGFFNYVSSKVQHERKDLVFVGFPFLTTFTAGFLFLIAMGYKKITFYRTGIVHLSGPSDFKNTLLGFSRISEVFNEINESKNDFKTDIIQIIPFSCIRSSKFFEALKNYNENFSKTLYDTENPENLNV